MTRDALDWLKRPFAHRGLHDEAEGIVENSASAIEAAIAKGYAIEVDLQCAAHGVPVVFHDRTLDRLTAERGPVADRDAAALCAIPLRNSEDRILSLNGVLGIVDGRVPLLIEVKSTWSDDHTYERNIAATLAAYQGDVAVMSFDPDCVAAFRDVAPSLPRGLIARALRGHALLVRVVGAPAFRHAASAHRRHRAAQLHRLRYQGAARARAGIARDVFHLPLLTWTVRSEADKAHAQLFADAMIFEGIAP